MKNNERLLSENAKISSKVQCQDFQVYVQVVAEPFIECQVSLMLLKVARSWSLSKTDNGLRADDTGAQIETDIQIHSRKFPAPNVN